MKFLNRQPELGRLRRLASRTEGGFGVVYGRRRVGKSRLLAEWLDGTTGIYTIADQSAPALQRRYLAEALEPVLPGFAEVPYPDWRSLFARLGREASVSGWRGPLVLDEAPYLFLTSPELPSILQAWLEQEARRAKLVTVVAGSSQRLMQGLVLSAEAPLFGRAQELLELRPLHPSTVAELGIRDPVSATEFLTAWGGIPRYWELATELGSDTLRNVAYLVLDPHGPLHREPDRLLLEELPSAMELRPLLDAIGGGAHKLSEIAARLARPATSLGRALQRLVELHLVVRETPFGEPPERSKRSLYRIADPFFRLWFRLVAPNRSRLVASPTPPVVEKATWEGLVAATWEDLCRQQLPALSLGRGPFVDLSPGQRWWHGAKAEWDVVSRSGGGGILLGEAKWSRRPFGPAELEGLARALIAKPHPELPTRDQRAPKALALFVPQVRPNTPPEIAGVKVIDGAQILQLKR